MLVKNFTRSLLRDIYYTIDHRFGVDCHTHDSKKRSNKPFPKLQLLFQNGMSYHMITRIDDSA